MTHRFSNTSLSFFAVITVFLASCGSGGEGSPPDIVDLGDAGTTGCIQLGFPTDQPDLSLVSPPRFLLTQNSSNGQALVRPGDPIEAEVTVNAATRRIRVELIEAWNTDLLMDTEEVATSGNQTVPLFLQSDQQMRGRFYMKITLCGDDCDEQQVVFDINPDINSPYERTVIEDRAVLQVDTTCIGFAARPNVGSGTVLVQ